MQRKVHTTDFIFSAMKQRRQGDQTAHDVYCSGCGTLTHLRANVNATGVAPNIWAAGVRVTWFTLKVSSSHVDIYSHLFLFIQ